MFVNHQEMGHPGLTQNHLKQTSGQRSLLYNGNFENENMTCAMLFWMLKRHPERDIFKNCSIQQRSRVKNGIIALSLSTNEERACMIMDNFEETLLKTMQVTSEGMYV